jgi:hypothetical protein
MKRILVVLFALTLVVPALRAQAPSQSLSGLWDAAVVVNGLEIPFRFEIAGDGAAISGSFFNGDEKVTSTGGKYENGSLTLNFDHYATQIEAALVNGRLAGVYNRAAGFYPFYARKFTPSNVFR